MYLWFKISCVLIHSSEVRDSPIQSFCSEYHGSDSEGWQEAWIPIWRFIWEIIHFWVHSGGWQIQFFKRYLPEGLGFLLTIGYSPHSLSSCPQNVLAIYPIIWQSPPQSQQGSCVIVGPASGQLCHIRLVRSKLEASPELMTRGFYTAHPRPY